MDIDISTLDRAPAPVAKATNGTQPTGILKWLPLLVMSLAIAIVILDTTILNVTLRAIVIDLNTTLQKIQWVITSYSLMLAAFTITGGRLGDLFGRKKMFVVGAIIFAIGSFMTSISHSVGFMIAGEAIVEGIGACLMMPATLSLLRSNYKGRDLQLAFGIWGGIIAGAAALGPVAGGWFTTHYSWRWAFRINVFVAAILVLSSVFIKEYREKEEKPTIDFVGVLLSALGMLSMVFGFIQATTYGWWHEKAPLILFGHAVNLGGISATPLFVTLGAIILGLFIWWETYMEKKDKTPLVSLELFSNKTFMAGSAVTGILSLGQAGLAFSIPIYLQAVLKLDPLHTGLAMIPMSAVILIAAPLSAFVSKHISPKRIIQTGILLDILGFIVLRQSLHVGSTPWALAPGFALFGLGIGVMMAQSSHLTLSSVSVEQSGEASGVTNTLRTLGQTLGSAVIGAVLLSTLATNITSGILNSNVIPETAKTTITQAIASQTSSLEFGNAADVGSRIPASIAQELAVITNEATVKSNKTVMSYGIAFMILALLVSTLLPKGKEVEAQSAAHHADAEFISRKKARAVAAVIILVVAGVAGTAGYDIAKRKYEPNSSTASPVTSTQTAVSVPTPTPAIINQNSQNPSTTGSVLGQQYIPETPVQTKTFQSLHFSVQIPQDWTVKQNGNEVIFTTPAKQQYSVQEQNVSGNDMGELKSFLESQNNIHNVTAAQIGGIPGYLFDVDGIYSQGWATLSNGRQFYLLGQDLQNSPLAKSIKVL